MSNWTVARYLWAFAGAVVVNLLVVGGFEVSVQKKFVNSYHELADSTFPVSQSVADFDLHHDKTNSIVLKSIASMNMGKFRKDPNLAKEIAADLDAEKKGFELNMAKLESVHLNPETDKAVQAIKPLLSEYLLTAKELIELSIANDHANIDAKQVAFAVIFESLEKEVGNLRTEVQNHVKASADKVEKDEAFYSIVSYVALALSAALALINALQIIRAISKRLGTVLSGLENESTAMNKTAGDVNLSAQTLSNSSTQQSAAIQETASSMEEMTQMVTQTTSSANESKDLADSGNHEAENGRDVLNRLVASMNEIESSNEKLESLVRLIEEIRNRTKVINDIVFETRLLSFNASIEAARAGVHGKGFSVVAEEVGKLANMSGKAAEEIRTLLDSSTQEVTEVVRVTKDRVSAGKNVTEKCKTVFGTMGDAMSKIADSVRSISGATKEQETGIRQVTKAINELEKVTLSNSKNADSLAGQASRLNGAALGLASMVHSLDALVNKSTKKSDHVPLHSTGERKKNGKKEQVDHVSQSGNSDHGNGHDHVIHYQHHQGSDRTDRIEHTDRSDHGESELARHVVDAAAAEGSSVASSISDPHKVPGRSTGRWRKSA